MKHEQLLLNFFVLTKDSEKEDRPYLTSSTPEAYCTEGAFENNPLFMELISQKIT